MEKPPKTLNPDFTTIKSDQVLEAEAADPALAEFMREFVANLRQAAYAVQQGQYASMDDAMEAITGSRPQDVDPDDLDPDELAEFHRKIEEAKNKKED